ncbi:MAG: hypothetical protein AB1634_06065 [Thermodesulfobacteriota bacterium]
MLTLVAPKLAHGVHMCYRFVTVGQTIYPYSMTRRTLVGASAQPETMLRKPILMPPDMIEKVDRIARRKKVSFAKVVREAVRAFNDAAADDEAILETLAETMITTTREVVEKIEKTERRLDDTHAALGASK